jgi:hypothetical protein
MAALSVQNRGSARRRRRPALGGGRGEALAEAAIAGDSARGRDAGHAGAAGGGQQFPHQHVDDGGLDAGAEVSEGVPGRR